jgi:hypothetical protein
MEDAKDASEACLERIGVLDRRRSMSRRSEKSSTLLPFLGNWVPPSSSFSLALCNAS